jgi:hypothetical protein
VQPRVWPRRSGCGSGEAAECRKKAPGSAHKLSNPEQILNVLANLGRSVGFMPLAQKTGKILQFCGKTFHPLYDDYKLFRFIVLHEIPLPLEDQRIRFGPEIVQ